MRRARWNVCGMGTVLSFQLSRYTKLESLP
jgi:hypothetical protein